MKRIIKVCGIHPEKNAVELGDLCEQIGFIFYPGSPRYVGEESRAAIQAFPAEKRVGVFVNAEEDQIRAVAERHGLSHLQLHGEEAPALCAALRESYQVTKAISIGHRSDLQQCRAYVGQVDRFVFDTRGARRGGNGVRFDWSILQHYQLPLPFLLSGGLRPEYARALNALEHPRLAGFDLNSGFEIAPGIKDLKRIQSFTQIIRNHEKTGTTHP